MDKKQFIEKWGMSRESPLSATTTRSYPTLFDRREEIERDLNELLSDIEDEEVSMNPGGWFRIVDHT